MGLKLSPFQIRWVGRLGSLLVRTLGATWRLRSTAAPLVIEKDDIIAILHGDILLTVYLARRTPGVALISEHGDGEIIAEVMKRLNKTPVRGSSTRGGARAVLRMNKDWSHLPWAVTPDGPRGPRGEVQPGVIFLASISGRRIVPLSFAVQRGKRLSSWDRFVIPYPTSRVVYHLGEPLHVPPSQSREQTAALAEELKQRLVSGRERADEFLRG